MKRDYTLLKYHMDCNPDYLFGHAIVAGKLASGEIKTYAEYRTACGSQGIACYNEALFNRFISKEENAVAMD